MIMLIVEFGMLLVLLGQFIKSDPTFTLFNPLELFHNLRLIVAGRFDDLPKIKELRVLNHAIVVNVDLVKEFLGRNFCEASFPVVQRLLLVNFLGVVEVETGKHFSHFLLAFRSQLKTSFYRFYLSR